MDYLVRDVYGLREALRSARPGEVVYLADDAAVDMTVWVHACREKIVVPAGVTLASGRGRNGSPGGLIHSDEFDTFPLVVTGGGVRITGLRLCGPDRKFRGEKLIGHLNAHPEMTWGGKGYNSFPISQGIRAEHPDLEVDNCELEGWSHAAIAPSPGARRTHIHHTSIHHCQRAGLGYGVCIDGVEALVEANLFDHTRYAVAGTGKPGTACEARNNIHGLHVRGHTFEVHGSAENNVCIDGRSIAGEWIKVHHNTFRAPKDAEIGLCGVPRVTCEIHHNWFFSENVDEAVRLSGEAVANRDSLGIHDNVWGPEETPWHFPKEAD